MSNEEITDYMHQWVAEIGKAFNKDAQILAAAIAIPVLLAEIAKRLPHGGGE